MAINIFPSVFIFLEKKLRLFSSAVSEYVRMEFLKIKNGDAILQSPGIENFFGFSQVHFAAP
jgi:hypothetical protein